MSCILNIETSTNVCSVAVSQEGCCIFNREDRSGYNHAERLGTFVQEAVSFADSHAIPVDAVAVSGGPGSYTGLRVGASMAKGMCYGRDIKLISVPTLEVLSVPVLLEHELEDGTLLCPMIDARRMEVYAAIYDRSLKKVRQIQADIVDETSYREYLDKGKVCFFGNGASKCAAALNHPNAIILKDIEPLAKYMFPLAEKRIAEEIYEDVAYFVPFYLKDFVAKPAKKLL
ncbi:MAG: tRNA (adenosine(37)-N6)-threonylcarbamoyltransferase complex dimerization subunit type 1 TsaB [Prevotella sp.]|nr:tRNA (adenosine(37)-N6)-threonylcarbamoyltransferase complex dimerization subunit type 1 TsaB [Prevotella sp.]